VVRKIRLRLGSTARSHFPAPLRRLAFLHRSLHRSGKDERTVTTACLQPDVTNGLQGPTSFKGQTRAHLILARRDDLQLKAEYICADLSSRPNFSLQSRGGPYIRNSLHNPTFYSQPAQHMYSKAGKAATLRHGVNMSPVWSRPIFVGGATCGP
jgi:hypothetical protein